MLASAPSVQVIRICHELFFAIFNSVLCSLNYLFMSCLSFSVFVVVYFRLFILFFSFLYFCLPFAFFFFFCFGFTCLFACLFLIFLCRLHSFHLSSFLPVDIFFLRPPIFYSSPFVLLSFRQIFFSCCSRKSCCRCAMLTHRRQ